MQNGPIVHRGEGEPSGIPVAVVLLPVFALTMVAVWAFMRYRKQLWNTCCLPVCPMNYFSYSPSLPFSHILSSLANTWFKVTDYLPKPCYSNLPRLQILMGEERFYLKKNWGEGGKSLAKNEWEVTYFTRTANKNSAITQRGKAQSSCYHGWHLFLSWRALKASCATWKEELIFFSFSFNAFSWKMFVIFDL